MYIKKCYNLFNKFNKSLIFNNLGGTMQADRTYSFSAKPEDVKSLEQIAKLKAYSVKSGISFSKLVIDGINLKNKELNLNDK